MKFEKPLVHGRLIKRYKRFLADVKLDDGTIVTAHCTNTGSMKTCLEENAEVYLTHHNDPKRKTQYTWEMILINGKWVGINTNNPNRIIFEAVKNNEIERLPQYTHVKREVKFGDSRFDVFAENDEEKCFIEVKNVTMMKDHVALFPDAVTSRGLKHLSTLQSAKEAGYRAVIFFLVQRMDVERFEPAKEIDKAYAEKLHEVMCNGVEAIVYQAHISPEEIKLEKELPL